MLRLKGKNIFHYSALILLGICTTLFWLYFLSSEKATIVNFESEGFLEITKESPSLVFAVAPVISPERNIEDYQELAGYLSQELRQPVRIIQRKTYHEINELMRIRKVDFAIVCTGAYLHARKNNIPMEIISVPVNNGQKTYHSMIITRSDSPILSIKDLKGRSFAFSDPISLTGYFYPLYLIQGKGVDPDKYFSHTLFTYSHNGSINVVLDKITDAAAVNNLVFEFELKHYPELANKIKVIHQSEPMGINPVVMNSGCDSLLRVQVQKAFLGLNNNSMGREILNKLGIEKFDLPNDSMYNGANALYDKVNNYLEGRNKIAK